MGKKSSSAPSADPRIGQAAMLSAKTGQDYLAFMKGQARTANKWAAQDRARHRDVFIPMQDDFIAEAKGYDSAERQDQAASQAVADVSSQAALAQQAERRQLAAMGVDPRSGRARAASSASTLRTGLARAGVANTARRQIQAEGRAMRAAAINMGNGLAVNPGTSLGLANGAASAGFNGAMAGYGQQGQLLNQQYQNELRGWEASQQSAGAFGQALGTLGGALIMSSSKKVKKDKKPVRRSLLKQVRSMPVEDWSYKDGHGDGGRHTGPYAEDFQKATGKGDGKTINVIDALGVTMGAVQELDKKVTQLARRSLPAPTAGKAA